MSKIKIIYEDDVVDALLKSTGTVQKQVRGYIQYYLDRSFSKEEIASAIAGSIVGAYKHKAELDSSLTRKEINNVINDISRICRQELGYSIVNTKRKAGDWVYEAIKYVHNPEKVTRVRTTPAASDTYTFISDEAPTIYTIPTTATKLMEKMQAYFPDSELPEFTKLYIQYVRSKANKEAA